MAEVLNEMLTASEKRRNNCTSIGQPHRRPFSSRSWKKVPN